MLHFGTGRFSPLELDEEIRNMKINQNQYMRLRKLLDVK
jgi:hypothetical protein